MDSDTLLSFLTNKCWEKLMKERHPPLLKAAITYEPCRYISLLGLGPGCQHGWCLVRTLFLAYRQPSSPDLSSMMHGDGSEVCWGGRERKGALLSLLTKTLSLTKTLGSMPHPYDLI